MSPLSSGTKARLNKLVGRHLSPRISMYMLVYMGIHQVRLAPMAMFSNVSSHRPSTKYSGRVYTFTRILTVVGIPYNMCDLHVIIYVYQCSYIMPSIDSFFLFCMGSRARKNWSTWAPLKKKRKLLHLTVLTDEWGGGGPSATRQA